MAKKCKCHELRSPAILLTTSHMLTTALVLSFFWNAPCSPFTGSKSRVAGCTRAHPSLHKIQSQLRDINNISLIISVRTVSTGTYLEYQYLFAIARLFLHTYGTTVPAYSTVPAHRPFNNTGNTSSLWTYVLSMSITSMRSKNCAQSCSGSRKPFSEREFECQQHSLRAFPHKSDQR